MVCLRLNLPVVGLCNKTHWYMLPTPWYQTLSNRVQWLLYTLSRKVGVMLYLEYLIRELDPRWSWNNYKNTRLWATKNILIFILRPFCLFWFYCWCLERCSFRQNDGTAYLFVFRFIRVIWRDPLENNYTYIHAYNSHPCSQSRRF